MDIEDKLNTHLNQFSSAPFLFVGSGFSRRYIESEDWTGLLRKFSEYTGKTYEYYFSKANGSLPQVASLLAKEFYEVWWREDKYSESRNINKCKLVNEESPLKIEIANYLRQKSYIYGLSTSIDMEIDQLKKIVVDGIITTNWDLLAEQLFPDFNTYIGQKELLFANPKEILEIYKIHGCSTEPDSLVLTSENYAEFKERKAYLAAKLLTMFIEHPIIFIGYRLSDSNILEIITSIIKCLTPENIPKLQNRLIFVERDKNGQGDAFFEGFLSVDDISLPITRLRTNNFLAIYKVLSQYKRKFSAKLIKHLKEQFYQIVVTNDVNGKIHASDIEDENFNPDDIEFYCGVGISSELSSIGYSIPTKEALCADVVFDTKLYEPVQTVINTLPLLLAKCRMIPVFKYLKESKLLENNQTTLDTKILNKFKMTSRDFMTTNEYENRKLSLAGCHDIPSLIRKYGIEKSMKLILLLDKESVDLEEFGEILKQQFGLLSNKSNSAGFRKLVCFYDWLKYSQVV